MTLASDFEQIPRSCGIDVNFFISGAPGDDDDDDMAFVKPIADCQAALADACTNFRGGNLQSSL